jgi:putative addiction module antidote
MKPIKITEIGNSLGSIYPAEMIAELKLKKGDYLYPVRTAHGIELRPYSEAFAKKVESARELMHEYRDVFHELAKR